MSDHDFRRYFLVLMLFLAESAPVFADLEWREKTNYFLATRHSPLAPRQKIMPLANSFSIGHFLTGGGRTRIVQICVLTMGLALYILMRKFNG